MTDSSAGSERPTNMWEELNRPKAQQGDSGSNNDRDERTGLPFVGVIAGGVAVATVVIAGLIVMGGGSDVATEEATVDPDEELALFEDDDAAADDANDADDASSDPGSDETAEEEPDTGDVSDTEGDDGAEAAPDEDAYSPAVPAGADGRYVVFSRGKLYLRGEMPTQAHVDGAVATLEQIMGEGNVIPEYVINPDTDFQIGDPSDVFIEDTVLFAFASAEIAPDFYPLLGIGLTLMQLQETVTIELYGHTDSTGPDDANMALSQARVDAVKGFFVAQGMDPARITAIGRGENEPVADNSTAQGQQLNRRVEMVINGFAFSA